MPRQIVARIFLVCAVLLAQQTALAHDFRHPAGQSGPVHSKNPDGKKFCDLHDLLGTVLGVVSVARPQIDLLSFSDIGFFATPMLAAKSRALGAQSRGPPPRS